MSLNDREAAQLVMASYVRDRAAQYREASGIRAALEDLAAKIEDGEAYAAADAGELDDLMDAMLVRAGKLRRSVLARTGKDGR